jgi:hypothetical protein
MLKTTNELEQEAKQQAPIKMPKWNHRGNNRLSPEQRRARWKNSRFSDAVEIVGFAAVATSIRFLASRDATNPLVTSNNLGTAQTLGNLSHPIAVSLVLLASFVWLRNKPDYLVLLCQLAIASLMAYGLDQLWFVAKVRGV